MGQCGAMAEIKNVFLLGADALLYFVVLASLLRARTKIGLGAFFCALGVMHFLETYLASILYVTLPFGIVTSPGSTILFTGKLMMLLLLVHTRGCRCRAATNLRSAVRQRVAIRACLSHAAPHSGLANSGPSRRFHLPQRNGCVDGVGNSDPVLRLHHYDPALRAIAELGFATAFSASGVLRCVGADIRPGGVFRRPAHADGAGADVLVGGLDCKNGGSRALRRPRQRLSAVFRAANQASYRYSPHLGRFRHAHVSRALRGFACAHRLRRADRRSRSSFTRSAWTPCGRACRGGGAATGSPVDRYRSLQGIQ